MVARLLLIGAIIFAVVVVAQGPVPSPPVPASAQGAERVEFRTPAPTCEQSIKELGLEGQPVHCIEPPAPTYDPPRIHGRYRLFPESYVGPLTYEDRPDSAAPGVVSDDIEMIRTSSIWSEPSWLPEGYRLSSISTRGYDSEHTIVGVYIGPGNPIQINRVRQFTYPIDVIMPSGTSATVFETPVLEGKPAVLYYPQTEASVGSGQTVLSFVDGDIETTILGDDLDPDTAAGIALSLICGTSCVSSLGPAGQRAAVPAPGTSPQPDLASGQETLGTSEAATSGFPNEQRVVAGLALTRVKVTSWWDHASGYGEAALDLQHPDGEEQTKKVSVYVSTWRWSGGGTLRFTTENYRHDPSYCDGRYVNVRDTAGSFLGRLTYVHLMNQAGEGDTWDSNPGNGWTIRYIGQVAETQDAQCVPSGYHAHLHQGQQVPSDPVKYNTTLPHPQGIIDPSNDPANNWMNRILFPGSGDWDGDGCTDSREAAMGFDAYNYWDFFDVPVPAVADPAPNGPKSQAINMGDVLAILSYVGAKDNWPPNSGGFDYDSVKDGDWNGDTIVTEAGDQVGLRYDRSPSAVPDPPWGAGPPSGSVAMADVLVALKQVNLSCSGPPPGAPESGASAGEGGALDSAPNAMAVDAIPGGGVDQWRVVTSRDPIDVDVIVAAAGEPYAGYDLALSYNDQILEFVPTVDLNGDTALESWTYTGLGGMSLNAAVSTLDEDGDTALDRAAGGSARSSGSTSATGAAVTGRFRCIANGSSSVHLVGPPEGTTTLAVGGGAIDTSLTDANVWCWGIQ